MNHFRFFIMLFCLLSFSALALAAEVTKPSAAAVEPEGTIYRVPVRVYGGQGGKDSLTTTAALLMPAQVGGTASVTLITQGFSDSRLVEIAKADAPPEAHFLFGPNDRIFAQSSNQQRVLIGPDRHATIIARIAYNITKTPSLSPAIRVMDVAGNPVTDTTATIDLYRVNSSGTSVEVQVGINADGLLHLPRIVGAVPEREPSKIQGGHSYGQLQVTHLPTGQVYSVALQDPHRGQPATVVLPLAQTAPPDGSETFASRVVNVDGSPASNVQLGFSYYSSQGRDEETTTAVARSVIVGHDGQVSVTASPDTRMFHPSKKFITASVREVGKPLMEYVKRVELQPGANPDIVLPMRQSLLAQLTDKNGAPVTLKESPQYSHVSLKLFRLPDETDAREHMGPPSHISVPTADTNGSTFTLPELPVPGRYYIEYGEKQYGPVDVGVTSPTELLQFSESTHDGKFVGRVVDENGQPLSGALVIATEGSIDRDDFTNITPLLDELKGASPDTGLKILERYTRQPYGYIITDESGSFSFPRKQEDTFLNLLAAAPDRYVADFNGLQNRHLPLSEDVPVPQVHLPAYAYAEGMVHAPAKVADDDHLGAMKPLPSDATYSVGFWGAQYWFAPRPRTYRAWRYEDKSETFAIGKPFRVKVPAGTTCSLRTFSQGAHLSMEIWRTTQTVAAGQTFQLEPKTMRAVYPFYLKVLDKNGKRLPGYIFSTLYSNMSRTDSRGVALCYHDEGMAPQVHVYPPGSGVPETFKMQPVDTSTSVPVVTIRLSKTLEEMGEAK